MPHIEFTADPKLPADMKHLGFRKGMTVELSADQCERWIRRNCAKSVPSPAPVSKSRGPRSRQVEPDPIVPVENAAPDVSDSF